MIGHDFDPWAEIQRLRSRPAKAANSAKPTPGFSRFSRFSQGEAAETAFDRCQRCLTLDSRNVEVLRCLACGYVHAPTGREHGARWPRRSRVDRRLRLVDGFRRGSVNA